MELRSISLEHYRNIEAAHVDFGEARAHFFVGANGQGKSNLLEALGLLTAVRSFRTHELAPLVQHRKRLARLCCRLVDDRGELRQVEIDLAAKTRSIRVDEVEVKRLAEFVGRFPTVVFSVEDIQMIRGGPQGRRRFFDLLFSVVDPAYLGCLQAYHRCLRERNEALRASMGQAVVASFNPGLAREGAALAGKRQLWMERFVPFFHAAYAQLSGEVEQGLLQLRASAEHASAAQLLQRLEAGFERDQALKGTSVGPHRDDYPFFVEGLGARLFASDGQQRCLALSLKLAQARLIESRASLRPVLLLDDVLGELDPQRQARFWEGIPRDAQVFATGTVLPERARAGSWRVYSVENGAFSSHSPQT
jgi:DNA replication and repair protein RecF